MGTFHTGKSQLHGITVLVETKGPEIYVGRCDDEDSSRVILLDVDVNADGPGDARDAYVSNASKWGVFPKHKRLVLDRANVTEIRRLADL